MDKTAQLVAAVLIVSFVIERVVATVSFFIDKRLSERREKILLVTITAALAALAVWKTGIRVLANGMQITTHPQADLLLTWLVFTAGADRIRDFIAPAASHPPADQRKTQEFHVFTQHDDGPRHEATPAD